MSSFFFTAEKNSILYIISQFVYLFLLDRHLSWLYNLVTVNSTETNNIVQLFMYYVGVFYPKVGHVEGLLLIFKELPYWLAQ